MSMYHRWVPQKDDLANLTPVKARDLICKCFFEAQKENFAEASRSFGQSANEHDLWNTVAGAIRVAFSEVDGEYDNPTRETLEKVVGVLARKASVWGTPKEIVEHHRAQIEKILLAVR
jgi:hypothetical protein